MELKEKLKELLRRLKAGDYSSSEELEVLLEQIRILINRQNASTKESDIIRNSDSRDIVIKKIERQLEGQILDNFSGLNPYLDMVDDDKDKEEINKKEKKDELKIGDKIVNLVASPLRVIKKGIDKIRMKIVGARKSNERIRESVQKKIGKKGIATALAAVTLVGSSVATYVTSMDKSGDSEVKTNFNQSDAKTTTNLSDLVLFADDKEVSVLINDVSNVVADINDVRIGSIIKVSDKSFIYQTTKDSILMENKFVPYFGYDDELVVMGVTLDDGNSLTTVMANMVDANKKIDNIVKEKNATIVSVLMANKKSVKSFNMNLPLSNSDLNSCAEGWFNAESVVINNERGYTK